MPKNIAKSIRDSRLTIYDSLHDRPDLFLDHVSLEKLLNRALRGLNLDYPLRTRSKVLKAAVCSALGYPIPIRFRRTQPRFPGQNFDTYVQKANNLQIWNEKVTASRRYVLIRVDEHNRVARVRVVTGEKLAALDTTGTLTHKYQARAKSRVMASVLVSQADTPYVVQKLIHRKHRAWPTFLPIADVFDRLNGLIGTTLRDPGRDQERNRGAALHRAVCQQLETRDVRDSGQFPDIVEQLLEIKLQTAATIDLGLVCPNQTDPLADFSEIRQCDVRYAVFYASVAGKEVHVTNLVLTTGADFFSYFNRFEGKTRNSKLQIPLPKDFFG